MKKFWVLFVAVVLLCATQAYGGQFGPITSRAAKGQFTVGGGYYYVMDKFDAGEFGKVDTKQHRLFLQGAYGFGSGWELYGRIGAANMQYDDAFQFLDSDQESDASVEPYGSLGVGGPIFVGRVLTIGPFLQASYFSDYKDERSGTFSSQPGKEQLFFDNAFEANLGFNFEVTLEGASLYGGPMVSYYNSKMRSVFKADSGSVQAVPQDGWADVEFDNNFGGFVGVDWPLTDRLNMSLEGQYRGGYAVGGTLIYGF